MASKTINSAKKESKVGASQTKIYTSVRTSYDIDENGKIDPKSVKHELLYYDAPLSPGVLAATKTGTSDWKLENNIAGKPVLGEDAVNSLKQGALKTDINDSIESSMAKEGLTPEQKKVVSESAASKAGEGGSDQTATNNAANNDIGSTLGGSKLTRESFDTNLYYPESLSTKKQDIICFEMLKYQPRTLNQEEDQINPLQSRQESKNRKVIGRVMLPIPGGISDRNEVNWGGGNLPVLEAMAANIMNAGITQGLGEAAGQTGNAAGAVSSNSSDVGAALASRFVGGAISTPASEVLSRTRGVIENPNLELLFQAPTLRPFSFNFKLTPRSNTEAARIVKIIRFFKQGMAPQRTQAQLFLRSPHTFQLIYKHQNEEHKFLNYFKECALTSFSVNYTPEGQYATYVDGSMVSYEISMEFQELEPVYNDEYSNIDKNADTHIGY